MSRKSKSRSPDPARLEIRELEPLSSAWDDHIAVSQNGSNRLLRVVVLNTSLQNMARRKNENTSKSKIGLAPYTPLRPQATQFSRETDVPAQCFMHTPSTGDGFEAADGVFLMLFEVSDILYFAFRLVRLPRMDANGLRLKA